MKNLFFGIDGGGTKSVLSVITSEKKLLCSVHGGPTNIYSCSKEKVCQNLTILFDTLEKQNKICITDFKAGCFASAGLDSEKEQNFFEHFFISLINAKNKIQKETFSSKPRIFFCNDAISALAGGIGKPEGIILISGTGSIAAGITKSGTIVRSGGFGHILGDQGSGFAIGLEGIKAATCYLDNLPYKQQQPSPLLFKLMQEMYNVETIRDLFEFIYTDFNKAKIAAFTPFVFKAAQSGDISAHLILKEAISDLTELATTVYNKLNTKDSTKIVFSGSILEKELGFSKRLIDNLLKQQLNLIPTKKKFDAAYGACLLAQKFYNES